jgi:hypothetical protein
MSLDPVARSLVDHHRRACGGGAPGGGGSSQAASAARAALVALLGVTPTAALTDALASAAGSAGTFKVCVGGSERENVAGCACVREGVGAFRAGACGLWLSRLRTAPPRPRIA